ncbi:MAG TPA: conjugal transfer protein TrbI, partial [Nitrosomonas sp.]|nr:conjugal transfer protein TrbI [Nitrosomonas sp.]
MSTDKLLSPDTSPDTVGKSIGVRRVNNLPLYIFGAIMLIFMLLMMVVAMNRATGYSDNDYADGHDVQSGSHFASLIAKDYIGGIIEPRVRPQDMQPVVEPERDFSAQLIIERPVDLDLPPVPPNMPAGDTSHQADLEHIRMLKRQQLEEAI